MTYQEISYEIIGYSNKESERQHELKEEIHETKSRKFPSFLIEAESHKADKNKTIRVVIHTQSQKESTSGSLLRDKHQPNTARNQKILKENSAVIIHVINLK